MACDIATYVRLCYQGGWEESIPESQSQHSLLLTAQTVHSEVSAKWRHGAKAYPPAGCTRRETGLI